MKYFLIFASLLFLSCTNDKDRISRVEEFLGTDLPTNYKMDYSEDMGLDMIEITLEENDFNELLKKIDTSKFEKSETDYYKNTEGEGDDVTRILFLTKEHKIKYSEKW
ncbi:hypothetical protein [Flavobacterium cerinum]|uniref:Uncharacterized protein n=1 Tax=Flavobacterium cerinum TaxID=2502784 RepID=A0A3S3RKG2_9FLAO|nr:hypothetical protein [Flavobacterium cerinum]RWX01532.1 hypothetical protein EPI11_06150 [Flavobacterium cerinum]